MGKYLYNYSLRIAKDSRDTYFILRKYEILLENEEQYVIVIGTKYFVIDKKGMFYKRFIPKDYIWKFSHYYIDLYTTEKNSKQLTKIKRALKQLIEENNFLSEVENIDLTTMLKDKSE